MTETTAGEKKSFLFYLFLFKESNADERHLCPERWGGKVKEIISALWVLNISENT